MNDKIDNFLMLITGTGSVSTGFFAWLAINGSVIAICLTIIAGTVTIISGIYAIYSKRRRNIESDEVIKTNKKIQQKLDLEIELRKRDIEYTDRVNKIINKSEENNLNKE